MLEPDLPSLRDGTLVGAGEAAQHELVGALAHAKPMDVWRRTDGITYKIGEYGTEVSVELTSAADPDTIFQEA